MHSDLHIRSSLEGERFSTDPVILINCCNVLRCLIDHACLLYLYARMVLVSMYDLVVLILLACMPFMPLSIVQGQCLHIL